MLRILDLDQQSGFRGADGLLTPLAGRLQSPLDLD
jgi:hypothetical protein